MKRIPRAAGLLGLTLGAVALNVVVPRELSRLGDPAGRPAPAPPAARGAGLLLVQAFLTHPAPAPESVNEREESIATPQVAPVQ